MVLTREVILSLFPRACFLPVELLFLGSRFAGWESGCSDWNGKFSRQALQRELARELPQQAILLTLHHAAARGRRIIVTHRVEHAVDEITDEFGLPGRSKLPRLLHGVVDADEDFSVKPLRRKGGRALGSRRR
jgi:hypothetical protein